MKVLRWQKENFGKIIDLLNMDGVVVLPTETLYGILAKATSKVAVERVYKIKGRRPNKPFIILVSDIADIEKFEIKATLFQKEFIERSWPNPISFVLSCNSKKWTYLHRETNTLAFRVPEDKKLNNLLMMTGPLIAPSTNPEGLPPALDIKKAETYFGEQIDMYVDGGKKNAPPSTIVSLINDTAVVLRGELKR